MDIILLDNVEKLGKKDELHIVKSGYARNYLIPQGLAVVANKSNRKQLNSRREHLEHRQQQLLDDAKKFSEKLQKDVIKVTAKVGEKDKIFGTITPLQLAEAIKSQAGIEVDRKKITLMEEVKKVGTYKAKVALHEEVEAEVDFEVAAEQ